MLGSLEITKIGEELEYNEIGYKYILISGIPRAFLSLLLVLNGNFNNILILYNIDL